MCALIFFRITLAFIIIQFSRYQEFMFHMNSAELLRNSPGSCFPFTLLLLNQNSLTWWAQVDSNHRPHAYQACALTTWAMSPFFWSDLRLPSKLHNLVPIPLPFSRWWRWGGSNSWPPACKAGALPAELHPQILQGSGYAAFFPLYSLFEDPFMDPQN